MKKIKNFNYEEKMWGVTPVAIFPFQLGAIRLKYCLSALKNVKGSVLEVGCGAGGFIKGIHLYRSDLFCIGIDISKVAIDMAEKDPQGVKFLTGNAYSLPFNNNTFDAVVFFDVLEHLDNPKKMLSECYRVLKKGGVLHAYIPLEGSLCSYTYYLSKVGWKVKKYYAGHIVQLTKKEVLNMAQDVGFGSFSWKWSNQFVGQLLDMMYFVILGIRGRNAIASVESYVAIAKKNIFVSILSLLVKFAAVIIYTESIVLSFIPSIGMHLSVRKKL